MAIPKSPIPLLLLLLTTAVLLRSSAAENLTEELVSDLLSLQSKSDNGGGVIQLNDHLLRRILSLPTPRPFSFLVFFDAKQLHSKTELNLQSLKSEFALVSKSFLENNKEKPDRYRDLFFFMLEFGESQSSFSLFAVNSLPHIKLIPGSAVDVVKDSVKMEATDFSGQADSMAEFIEAKTKLKVSPINRPPMISKKQMMVVVAVILIWAPYVVKRVLLGKTLLHNKSLWMLGAVFVYFFSVSGTMHNIIRKMPLFLQDRNDPGKLVFFYQGNGMQLGAEGFAVGFLYTVVGLLLAFATHLLVVVQSRNAQRILMLVVLFVSFWAVQKVISLDNWKTGYGIHSYWPSSWR